MLQALNTGHDGGLSTAHGNSSRDILSRSAMDGTDGNGTANSYNGTNRLHPGIDLIVHSESCQIKAAGKKNYRGGYAEWKMTRLRFFSIYQLEGTEAAGSGSTVAY